MFDHSEWTYPASEYGRISANNTLTICPEFDPLDNGSAKKTILRSKNGVKIIYKTGPIKNEIIFPHDAQERTHLTIVLNFKKYFSNTNLNIARMTVADIETALVRFSKEYAVDLSRMKAKCLETTIDHNLPSSVFLDNIIAFRGIVFKEGDTRSPGHYKVARSQRWLIKTYDKKKQKNLSQERWRFERSINHSEEFRKLKIVTAEDLLHSKAQHLASKILVKSFRNTTFIDPTIRTKGFSLNDKIMLRKLRTPYEWDKKKGVNKRGRANLNYHLRTMNSRSLKIQLRIAELMEMEMESMVMNRKKLDQTTRLEKEISVDLLSTLT